MRKQHPTGEAAQAVLDELGIVRKEFVPYGPNRRQLAEPGAVAGVYNPTSTDIPVFKASEEVELNVRLHRWRGLRKVLTCYTLGFFSVSLRLVQRFDRIPLTLEPVKVERITDPKLFIRSFTGATVRGVRTI